MSDFWKQMRCWNPNIETELPLAGSTDTAKANSKGTCSLSLEGSTSPKFIRWYLPNYPVHWFVKKLVDFPFVSQKGNKYLKYQYNRMERARNSGNSKLYWAIGLNLLKNSKFFRLALMRHSLKGWYYCFSIMKIMKINFELNKILKLGLVEAKSNRFYVPKANNKLRPIGAPEPAWKLVSAAMNLFLLNWVEPVWLNRQHAYRPNKGIWTAWLELCKQIPLQDNIYEFDLTKFFNRVPHIQLFQVLELLNLPRSIVYWFTWINKFLPAIKEGIPVDKEDPDLNKRLNKKIRGSSPIPWPGPNPREFGVAQGFPSSPTLAILVLEWSKIYSIPGIQYADDGIWFPPAQLGDGRIKTPWKWVEFESILKGCINCKKWGSVKSRNLSYPFIDNSILDSRNIIIRFNERKSKWIRYDTRWLVQSFTFLGIKYLPELDSLEVETKDGTIEKLSRTDALSHPDRLKLLCGKVKYSPPFLTTESNEGTADWKWEVHNDSLFIKHLPNYLIWAIRKIHDFSILLFGRITITGELGAFLEKFFDVRHVSTVATNIFLAHYGSKLLKFQRSRSLRFLRPKPKKVRKFSANSTPLSKLGDRKSVV